VSKKLKCPKCGNVFRHRIGIEAELMESREKELDQNKIIKKSLKPVVRVVPCPVCGTPIQFLA